MLSYSQGNQKAHLRWAHLALLAFVLHFAGCGGDEGPSDYQLMKMTQDQSIAEIEKMGGQAASQIYPLGNAFAVNLSKTTITDETFKHLAGLERVAELDLSNTSITDAQIPEITKVGGYLVKLDLSNTAVTDEGIAGLSNLSLLMDLNLEGTKVTSKAAEELKAKRQSGQGLDIFKNMNIKL